MNILVLWRTVPTQWHVSTNFLPAIIKYLNIKGNTITLICFDNNHMQENIIEELKKHCNLHIVPYPKKCESIINNFMFLLEYRRIHNPFAPFSFEMVEHLNKIISEEGFDIIFIDQTTEIYITNLCLEAKKILYLVDPLNYSSHQYLLNETRITKKLSTPISTYFQRKYDLTSYKKFDGYILPAQEHKELLQPYLNPRRKSYIIPQGIDTDFFTPDYAHSEPNTILFSGSMNYPPNVTAMRYFFENIYDLIKVEIPDLKVFIVGRNPAKEVLKYQSKDVIVTGFVRDNRDYFVKSAVVFVPIVVDDGGYKVKVLEAMAMGKPCVSTSLGIKGLYVNDGKNILIADTPADFAKNVILLLRNTDLRDTIGINARGHVEEHYSLENMCKQVNNAFQDILQERRQYNQTVAGSAGENVSHTPKRI